MHSALILVVIACAGCAGSSSGNDASACTPIDAAVGDGGVRTTIRCNCDVDCPPELPTCEPTAKVCVGCLAEQNTCKPGFRCSNAVHECVPVDGGPECTANTDCPPIGEVSQRSICSRDAGVCVECLRDTDCGDPKPVCDNGTNAGAPDAGQTPSFRCIDGCELCIPPAPVCDRVGMRCLPVTDGGARD